MNISLSKPLPQPVMRKLEEDPMIIIITLGALTVLALTLFFCFAFDLSWRFRVFALLFFPPAIPIGFCFGRYQRALTLKKMKEEEKEEEEEEETKQIIAPKKKKGKVLSQFEMSKKLSKWSKKSELQKSAEAQQLSEEEQSYDI